LRDNRITKATDTGGRSLSYAYSGAGDLDKITSPLNQTSRKCASAAGAVAYWTRPVRPIRCSANR
jgi:YD repeat-containing protein